VAFSAGSILGAACLDLLPRAIELVEKPVVFIYIVIGFIFFFFLERFIYWYHGHGHETEISAPIGDRGVTKSFVYLNLLGDAIHNFIDGMVIAASFPIGFSVGLAVTIAVIFHELPQEMGDYGILLYGGFKRWSALFLNFFVALTVVLGGIFAVLTLETAEASSGLLVAFATGGFIFLAASELLPELRNEKNFKKSVIQFFIFVLGVILIWLLGIIFPE